MRGVWYPPKAAIDRGGVDRVVKLMDIKESVIDRLGER